MILNPKNFIKLQRGYSIKKHKMENTRDRILKSMAIFMSCLIITIPFYVADVFAVSGTVNIKSIKGKEGVDASRTAADNYVDVAVEITATSAVNPSDVLFKYYTSTKPDTFTSCDAITPTSFGYNCEYKSSTNTMQPNVYTINVCLAGCCFADCKSCTQSKCLASATLYVDGLAPSIKSFDISPKNTAGKGLSLAYNAEDKLCSRSSCAGKCSGIKKIEVVDEESGSVLAASELNSKDCAKTGTISFDMTSVPNGARQVCVKAYDMLGQANNLDSHSCAEINKDSSMPVINVADIFDANGASPLRYAKAAGTDAKFIVNISSSKYYGISKATADLSGFNLGKVDLVCRGSSGDYECEKAFNLQVSGSASADVLVNITDAGGNNVQTTSSITIDMDSEAPVVEAILTEHNFNSTGYFGMGKNNVTAVINDAGAGLAGGQVTITIESDTKNALCSPAGDKWRCTVSNIIVTGDTAVTVRGKDDAGNQFTPFTRVLVYDKIKPDILHVTIRNIANTGTSQGMPYFMAGDDMLVTAFIEEDSGMKDDSGNFNAFAYFDGFAAAGWTKATDCSYANQTNSENGNKVWKCSWEVLNIQTGTMKIRFNETDIAGNKDSSRSTRSSAFTSFHIEYYNAATDSYIILPESEVEVYFQETEEAPDYWTTSAASHSPDKVDSKTAALVAHDVWFKLLLEPNVDDVSLVSVTLEKCQNPSAKATDYESYANDKKTTLVNPTIKSVNPWLRIGLKIGEIDESKLEFNCSLNIVSLKSGKLSHIEKDDVLLSVGVIKQDDIADSVQDEIDRVKNGWIIQVTEGWVPMLAKIFDLANQFCNILYVFRSLLTALALVDLALSPFQGHPVATAAEKLSEASEKMNSGMWAKMYKYCDYISCRRSVCEDPNKKTGIAKGGDKEGKGAIWYCEQYNNKWFGDIGDKLTKSSTPNINNGLNRFGQTMAYLGSIDFISNVKPQCKEPKDSSYDPNKCKVTDMSNIIGGQPADGLWGSVRTVCIPGIIKSLNNAREIECQYLYCLNKEVPAGIPIYACTSIRSYSWCMFFWGEIFQILPFTAFIKGALASIKSMFENPQQLIFGYLFKKLCTFDNNAANAICRIAAAYQSAAELGDIFQQMSDNKDLFNFDTDICDEALKED